MAAVHNFELEQGEDLVIAFVYKTGPEGESVPVNLTSYDFRMDIVAPDGKVLTVLNEEAIEDTDPYVVGAQPDNGFEVTLGATGEVRITLSRALTLPGGVMFKYINANPSVRVFTYDMFLRDNMDMQKKIMGGTITVQGSVTHWL